jgi:hypothetical protein
MYRHPVPERVMHDERLFVLTRKPNPVQVGQFTQKGPARNQGIMDTGNVIRPTTEHAHIFGSPPQLDLTVTVNYGIQCQCSSKHKLLVHIALVYSTVLLLYR